MAQPQETQPQKTLGERLQSLPKHWLFFILILATALPLLLTLPVPNQPAKPAQDFFDMVNNLPPNKPVLIASDWTNSTRGESAGEFKALIRMLMRQNIKFAVYTTADAQAPQVAKDAITVLNEERKAAGDKPYEKWTDWVSVGFFANAEATANLINADVRGAFGSKTDVQPGSGAQPVFKSPVLSSVNSVADFGALIVVTGSNTSNVTIERVTKVPMAMAVTGVMGPETLVYYDSGQLKGLLSGLKGVYDIEGLMAKKWPDKKYVNLDQGAKYYPSLQFALALLILAIVVGNVGMVMTRRAKRS